MKTITVPRIQNDAEYRDACFRIEALADASAGTAEHDEREILIALVQAYDRQNAPVTPADPISAVRHAMDRYNLKPSDMVAYFGASSRVYDFLNGKRPLSLDQIRRLHANLRIPLEHLIGKVEPAPGRPIPKNRRQYIYRVGAPRVTPGHRDYPLISIVDGSAANVAVDADTQSDRLLQDSAMVYRFGQVGPFRIIEKDGEYFAIGWR
jgi:HTH-type transcriptional regulator / antitoxin HigA